MYRVLAVSGSLRAASSNRGLVEMARRLAPPELDVEVYEGVGELAFYNPDLEADVPASAARWRAAVIAADALLLAAPEYNYGPSGVMKNAIDWATRPMPGHPLSGKVIAIVTSGGKSGGWRVQAGLGEILGLLGNTMVMEPKITVELGAKVIAPDGTTTDPAVEALMSERLGNMLAALRARAES